MQYICLFVRFSLQAVHREGDNGGGDSLLHSLALLLFKRLFYANYKNNVDIMCEQSERISSKKIRVHKRFQ